MNGYINNKVNYYLYLHAQQQYQISRFSAQICLQFYFLPGLLKTSLSFLESGKKKKSRSPQSRWWDQQAAVTVHTTGRPTQGDKVPVPAPAHPPSLPNKSGRTKAPVAWQQSRVISAALKLRDPSIT